MDLNLTVIAGRLAAPIEVREFDSGAVSVRALLTVRTWSPRRRVDVVPVLWWAGDLRVSEVVGVAASEVTGVDGSDLEALRQISVGSRLYVTAQLQRRFVATEDDRRRSRIEVVASSVRVLAEDETIELAGIGGVK